MLMIATVTLSPALDVTMTLRNFSPGAVNRATDTRVDAGGKGVNVSKTLRILGAHSVAYGVLGGASGEEYLDLLSKAGVETHFIMADPPTRRNIKLVDLNSGETTDINASAAPLDEGIYVQVLKALLERLTAGDIAVLAGKAPMGAPDTLYADWTEILSRRGVRVMIDAEGAMLANAVDRHPAFVKPNADEMRLLTGRDDETAARVLLSRGVGAVLLTRGAGEAIYADNACLLRAMPPRVPVLSTVGAGDAAMAGMAFAVEKGMGAWESVRLAMACGSAKAMRNGTQAPEMEDIRRLLPLVEISEESI